MNQEIYPRNLIEDYYNDGRGPTESINGYNFYLTCGACPEQYDVFKNHKQVAYVRLRGGRLRVDMPDVGEKQVYFYQFDDFLKGEFASQEERIQYLTEITGAIDLETYNF